jgi:1-deoxyxylulose-5-phosphate synthase
MAGRRDEFIVATKCFFRTGPKPWDAGSSRKNIMRAIDASLRRLGTDYVDLYQLHSWDIDTPIDETLRALDDVIRSGKVRYVGCSNFLAYQLARSVGRAEVLGTAAFVSVQPRYNLLFRENERELFPLCADEGIAVIPYNPLAGGFLSGKHRPGAPTDGGRFTLGHAADRYQERYWHDRMFTVVDELRPIADEAGVSMATMSMQWVLSNPVITSPIIGASKPGQLADSIVAVATPLDPDVKSKLDELTHEFRFGDNAR